METKIGPAAIDQEQASVDYSVIDGAIGKVFPGELEHQRPKQNKGAARSLSQVRQAPVSLHCGWKVDSDCNQAINTV
jgi:hypothetical protein